MLKGRKLQPRYVQALVSRLAGRAKIDKGVSPHKLRHSSATDLLRKTGNLELVRRALGHANLQTTQIYVHLTDQDLDAAMLGFRCEAVAA